MLSRRSIRIKAMQTVYAMQVNDMLTLEGAQKNLQRSISNAYAMYLYIFLIMIKVAEYVKTDNQNRAQKLLKINQTDTVNPLISEHPILKAIADDDQFQLFVKQEKLAPRIDSNTIIKCYQAFIKHKDYQSYCEIAAPHTDKQHVKILLSLLRKVMTRSEVFLAHLEDIFLNWDDDCAIVITAVANDIKTYNSKKNPIILQNYKTWKERRDFARNLLKNTFTYNEEYIQLIKPQLINWELDRVNNLDVILLKMALCELIYFPTIPVKVTINEYIEIAKEYSTNKSKDFINGILDALLKKLKEEGKIKKLGRGLVES